MGLGTVSSIYKKLFDIINAQVIRGTNYHFIALLSGNLVSNTNMPHSAQEQNICIFDVLSATAQSKSFQSSFTKKGSLSKLQIPDELNMSYQMCYMERNAYA